ncbi:hypothetical protein BZA77DRAFT_259648 [Pyronema omphalodes]|nr:hypothetical protein BZA77DRAFT_259648 [Pyronema omphalodes]
MAATTATAVEAKKPAVVKPEKPDEEAFKKAEAILKKEHADVLAKLKANQTLLDSVKPGGKNPRLDELKVDLNDIRSKQKAKKNSREKDEEAIKALTESINARVKDLNAKRGGMAYRSIADLEAAVARLDKNVSSGNMKIVEEKRALQEISQLNKQKKNFAAFEEQQAAIDADRAKLKAMKEKKQDPEVKQLSDLYDEKDREFKALKAEADAVFANLNKLRDERTRLNDLQKSKWNALKKLQDDYYQSRTAYRAYEKEARKIREERRAKEQAEYLLKKKLAAASERMEAASQPAFASEIMSCEGLIAYFDPSSAEAAKKAKLAATPRDLAAKATREVGAYQGKKPVKVLVREEEQYFVGTGGKNGKKGRKAAPAPVVTEEKEDSAANGKINLNLGLLEELSRVDVFVPSSRDEVPKVLEILHEKLQWYKDNQDRVTKENIAKAQKEIDRLEKEDEAAAAPAAEVSETASPAAEESATEAPAAEEKKEEEAVAEA